MKKVTDCQLLHCLSRDVREVTLFPTIGDSLGLLGHAEHNFIGAQLDNTLKSILVSFRNPDFSRQIRHRQSSLTELILLCFISFRFGSCSFEICFFDHLERKCLNLGYFSFVPSRNKYLCVHWLMEIKPRFAKAFINLCETDYFRCPYQLKFLHSSSKIQSVGNVESESLQNVRFILNKQIKLDVR